MAEPPLPAPIALRIEQPVRNESALVLLRSQVRAIARRMDFAATDRERLEVTVNEVASNQLKHAGAGFLQVWESRHPVGGLDVFALDYGPGVPDLENAIEEGHSSVGTLGRGLGSMLRLADAADLFTIPAARAQGLPWHGLAAWTRFCPAPAVEPEGFELGLLLRAYHDHYHSGDRICLSPTAANGLRWLHLDGSGHGEEAERIVTGLDDLAATGTGLAGVLERIGERLRGTCGAVAAVGEIHPGDGTALVMGLGDMAAYRIEGQRRHPLTFPPGILGQRQPGRPREAEQIPLPEGTVLMTASDGIRTGWDPTEFPDLFRRHPQLVAFLLGHILGRANDDRSLAVFRLTSHSAPEQRGLP